MFGFLGRYSWADQAAQRDAQEVAQFGNCGYKGPPDVDEAVEIAYGIDPAYRGRGYATEAARALAEYSMSNDQVRVVCAHTRPDGKASMRVLGKLGFKSQPGRTSGMAQALHRAIANTCQLSIADIPSIVAANWQRLIASDERLERWVR